MYVLNPANSDMDNGFKKLEMSPEKNSYTAETGNWKRHFLKGTRITRPLEMDNLTKKNKTKKTHFFYSFSFQKVPLK